MPNKQKILGGQREGFLFAVVPIESGNTAARILVLKGSDVDHTFKR